MQEQRKIEEGIDEMKRNDIIINAMNTEMTTDGGIKLKNYEQQ